MKTPSPPSPSAHKREAAGHSDAAAGHSDAAAGHSDAAAGHSDAAAGHSDAAAGHSDAAVQIERRRRELWIYMAVSLVAVEMLIFIGALCYGFIMLANKGADAPFHFPWLAWAAISVTIPAIILISVHLAGVGLFKPSSRVDDEEWQKHLPEKLQKAFRIIYRAPAVVLLGCIFALGAVLFTLEGAFTLVESFFVMFRPYILHILGGLAGLLVIFGLAAIWLNYRSRHLFAEYEYRREVLRQTGLIIVDKNSHILQPGESRPGGYAMLESASVSSYTDSGTRALPQGTAIDVSVTEQNQ